MGVELNITDEVRAAGFSAFALAVQGGYDGPQIYAQTIAVAAPLIVAAELERLANEWSTGQVSSWSLVDHLRCRASELRGEGQ